MQSEILRLGRFILVGASNTLISFLTFKFVLGLLPEGKGAVGMAQVASYGAGVLWSYHWNRKFVFPTGMRGRNPFHRFLASQLFLLVASSLAIEALVAAVAINPSLAWLLVMAIVTVLNFVILRAWVYRPT